MFRASLVRSGIGVLPVSLMLSVVCWAQDSAPAYLEQEARPATKWHLTARPWQPLGGNYLDIIEGTTRYLAGLQEASGLIRSPNPDGEPFHVEPSGPAIPAVRLGHFSYQVGILYKAGRSTDLLNAGIRAMDYDTEVFQYHVAGMRTQRLTPLFTEGLPYAFEVLGSISAVPQAKKDLWRSRLFVTDTARQWIMTRGGSRNSFCYRMQTEWNRLRLGAVTDSAAVINTLEKQWVTGSSAPGGTATRPHIVPTRWNLFKDGITDPESLSTEAAGRVNLMVLTYKGYNGPSAGEIRAAAERGTHTMLLLQDPTGQTPPNGRTDNHNWVDAGNAAAMELMAERVNAQGNAWLAGQFRRSAVLTMNSIRRFRRSDGTYTVTKNQWDNTLSVGHQGTFGGDYVSKVATHVAQAHEARKTAIPERPAPAELGGYAINLDARHSAAVANAGGMMMQVNLRGEKTHPYGGRADYDCHTPLGVVRFGRVRWDTRLGPGDGVQNQTRTRGISFAPTLLENGAWIRLADIPGRYTGAFSVQLAHPLLVRCVVNYTGSGPAFRNEFILTPDGIVSVTTGSGTWGMTAPLLVFDGKTSLNDSAGGRIARTSFPGGGDEQCFIALNGSASLAYDGGTMRSAYGDLQSVRITNPGGDNRIFVYPRNAGDPTAEQVRDSFRYTGPSDFSSILGRVQGNVYVGRTSAGGVGTSLDLNGDGTPEATFAATCGFVFQVSGGSLVKVETDRNVTATINGQAYSLTAYTPVSLTGTALPLATIAATDASASESGPDAGTFVVSRTGSTAAALTVSYSRGGTATGGTDYAGLGTTVTIPAGSSSATLTVTPVNDSLAEGNETVVVTLLDGSSYNLGSPASATISIADDDAPSGGTGTGLRGDYYSGPNFNSFLRSQTDPAVDFEWRSPAPEEMSVIWTGWVEPQASQTYTFYTVTDDGVRLWVNGQLLIDHWADHGSAEDRGAIALAAGQRYAIRMEYYKNGIYGEARLLWSSPSLAKQIIPRNRLYPASARAPVASATALKSASMASDVPPAAEEAPKDAWDASTDGSGGSGGACGATGVEVLLVLGLLGRRRRRANRRRNPSAPASAR